jgi:5-methyltetrahydrofolate--homocysteine methyltransferase
VKDKRLTAKGVYGYFPAHREGDDIVLSSTRFPMLRQQLEKLGSDAGKPFLSLADFVAPEHDHIGAFAVTAGIGLDAFVKELDSESDNYGAIIAKALADRLAEAFAENLHERVRHEWYAKDEKLSQSDLISEKYRGIRPAFGYPACPDHSEKRTLFALLGAERADISLTESFAMLPAASVSGLYFAHPEARYFNVGRVARDQIEDYALRKNMPVEEVERWLAPNLAY